MAEEEYEVQRALGTLKEFAIVFIFGQPHWYENFKDAIEKKNKVSTDIRNNPRWAECIYTTTIYAVNEKDALIRAQQKTFKKKEWQKGFCYYQIEDNPELIRTVKMYNKYCKKI